jgi:hypothetical protein
LAQATYSGETASGWQQANFSAPAAVAANTVYVAAYFSTTGIASDQAYFVSAGVNNAPLHALQNGVSGPNGVYAGGTTPAPDNRLRSELLGGRRVLVLSSANEVEPIKL